MSARAFSEDIEWLTSHLHHESVMQCFTALDTSSPIRKISMIGAQTHFNQPDRLQERDRGFLQATFTAMAAHSIAVHPDFGIDVVNIHPRYGGRSFFKETKPADLIVLCFVFNPDPRETPEIPHHLNPEHQRDRLISVDHFKPGIWHDTALRLGAKFVSTAIGQYSSYQDGHITEVNHKHFLNVPNARFEKVNNHESHEKLTLMRRRDFFYGAGDGAG